MAAALMGVFYAFAALAVQLHAAAAAAAFMAAHAESIAFPRSPYPPVAGGAYDRAMQLCAGPPLRLAPCTGGSAHISAGASRRVSEVSRDSGGDGETAVEMAQMSAETQ